MGKIILNGVVYTVDININDETPTFTEAQTRANIQSGESVSTLFGKIKKWFTDLKTVAFSGSYNDLSDQPTIPSIGGHAIKKTDGSGVAQEDNLQFLGVYTNDDANNHRTQVNIVRQMTKAAMQALSSAEKEGFIDTTDEDDDYIPISAEDVKYGNTDVDSALDDIYSRISGGSRTVTTLVNESVNLAQSGSKTYAPLTTTYLSQFDEVTFLCNWGSPVGALVMTKAMISKTATVYGNSGAVGISSGAHYGSFTFGSSGMVVRNGSSSTMVSLLVEGITY